MTMTFHLLLVDSIAVSLIRILHVGRARMAMN